MELAKTPRRNPPILLNKVKGFTLKILFNKNRAIKLTTQHPTKTPARENQCATSSAIYSNKKPCSISDEKRQKKTSPTNQTHAENNCTQKPRSKPIQAKNKTKARMI